MFHVVATDEDKTAPAVDRRLVDHGEPRLASAGRPAAEPSAAEPPHQPDRQRQQNDDHDRGDYRCETGSLAQQVAQDRSSLCPGVRRIARADPKH
jgi:hypothetical protein